MQDSNISLIILIIFVPYHSLIALITFQHSSRLFSRIFCPNVAFLIMVNAPAAKAFQQNLVANHQISNVVVDQSCGYINGSSSVTPIGQMGSPLGEAINPEVKDLHEFVNDHLDNGNNLIPSFCSVESSIRYIGRNIDGDEVQKINVDEEDLFSDMIGFYKSAKLNQSAKLKV